MRLVQNISVENSLWTNVGNGFYQSTLESMIRRLFPGCKVFPGDGPVAQAFRIGRRSRAFDPRVGQCCDLAVLSGPILSSWWTHHSDYVEKLVRSGGRYAFVSVSAGAKLSLSELDRLYAFMKAYPPVLIATRDEATFEYLNRIDCPLHNGVCAAWFAPDYIPHSTMRLPQRYFCSSFHRMLEPTYEFTGGSNDIYGVNVIERRSLLPYRIARLIDSVRECPGTVGEWMVLRPQHALGLRFDRLQFPAANSLASYNPASYLSYYEGSDFVVTDRVHAAVVSLAMGKCVRLMYDGFRAGLFSAMGVDADNHGVLHPPPRTEIESAHNQLSDFLVAHLQ